MDKFLTSEQFDVINEAIMQTHNEIAEELGGSVDPTVYDRINETLLRFVKDKPKTRNAELYSKGNLAAENYLKLRGYEILEVNWECRFGSIDIIAIDEKGTWCFIEVQTRRGVETGLPDECLSKEKQERLEKIALCYLMENDDWQDNDPVRFDSIGICVSAPHRALLRHHKGIFNGLS